MTDVATLTCQDNIAVIQINRPPVNALSHALIQSLRQLIAQIESDKSLEAVLIYAAGPTFVCGADIGELSASSAGGDAFNPLMNAIENLKLPVAAVLHGSALGGGLELAMACHYRVALPGTQMGLPEVLLGVLPGAGGTQRLPRLIGAVKALELISTGKTVSAQAALDMGIIDALVEGEPLSSGLSYVHALLSGKKGPRPTRERSPQGKHIEPDFFARELELARSKKAAYPAAERIVRCVEAAATLRFDEGQKIEQALFHECQASTQAQAMQHLFFAQRSAAKIPGLAAKLPLRPIAKVGVIGAGTMGGGIAMNFLNAGIPVAIVETSQEALDRGLGLIQKNYENSAAKGKLKPEQVNQRMRLLQGSLDYNSVSDCDLVIEAVFENLEIKKQVCARLGQVCKPGAIIATNTSTLDVNVLAQATGRAQDTLGMHFFSPANVMRLLEVVRGDATAPDVLATVMQLARTIKKVPVVSGVCYGFIGNRMLESYLREADFLLMEGATPAQIDGAIEALGLAMGPCRMLDMAGTDVAAKVVLEQGKAGLLPQDDSYRAVVRKLFEEGRNGQKAKAGYYRYDGRNPVQDPEAIRLFSELARQHGIARRTDITDQEIVERCLYPLINEGARILEEGIAYRPGDIDVVWVCGYGFPDHKGGPIFMADQIGLEKISQRLKHYGDTRGNSQGYWTQSSLLAGLAQKSERLSDWTA